MLRAAVWWESGVAGGDSAPPGPPQRGVMVMQSALQMPPSLGAPCSQHLAGRSGAARSCRLTAKPSGWQDARKQGWCSAHRSCCPLLCPSSTSSGGQMGKQGAVCLSFLPPLAPCGISCLLHLLWGKKNKKIKNRKKNYIAQTHPSIFICAARGGPRRNGAGQEIQLICNWTSPGRKLGFPHPIPCSECFPILLTPSLPCSLPR